MERTTKVRRSSMFLLELMITILLFSVTSAVCIRVFAQAHAESQQAQLLTEATGACSNAAELLRTAASPEEALRLLEDSFGALRREGNLVEISLTGDALLEITDQVQDGLHRAEIRYLLADDSCVYALDVSRFFPEVNP